MSIPRVRIEKEIFNFDDNGQVLYAEFYRITEENETEATIFINMPYIDIGDDENKLLHDKLMQLEVNYFDILKYIIFPDSQVVLK